MHCISVIVILLSRPFRLQVRVIQINNNLAISFQKMIIIKQNLKKLRKINSKSWKLRNPQRQERRIKRKSFKLLLKMFNKRNRSMFLFRIYFQILNLTLKVIMAIKLWGMIIRIRTFHNTKEAPLHLHSKTKILTHLLPLTTTITWVLVQLKVPIWVLSKLWIMEIVSATCTTIQIEVVIQMETCTSMEMEIISMGMVTWLQMAISKLIFQHNLIIYLMFKA